MIYSLPSPEAHSDSSDASGTHSDQGSLLVLLTFTVAELLLLIASIVLPIPNGCFFPIFVIGAASGRFYAEIAQLVFGIDGDALPPAVVSVAGAAALAAGTTQTLSTARSPCHAPRHAPRNATVMHNVVRILPAS